MQGAETPKANPENLLQLIQDAYRAKVVLPEFQRSFVWGREDIEEFLTSILQGYFVGTFLVLDTPAGAPMFPFRTIEGLERLTSAAGSELHQTVRLVLDGQQRITSTFYALYAPPIPLRGSRHPYKFYLLLDEVVKWNLDEAVVGVSERDSGRMARITELVRVHRALPFTDLRDSSSFYRWLYSEQQVWQDGQERQCIETLYNRLQRFMIPVVSLSPETGRDNIVNIFERINRTGVNLSLFDLVGARLYVKGLELRRLWNEFEQKHRSLVDVVKPEFLLKVLAILSGKEPRKGSLLDVIDALDVGTFGSLWEEAGEALSEAYERISRLYGAYEPDWIPYTTMIVPLAVLLHELRKMNGGEDAYRKLDRWYWASVFTQRYDSAVDTKSHQDVRDVHRWMAQDTIPEWLSRVTVEAVDFNVEEPRSAVYRGLMCLIAREGARDFLTGQPADLHTCQDDHVFPFEVFHERHPVDILLNRTLISKETNNRKRSKLPSRFLDECLASHDHDETRLLATLASHFITREAYEALKRDDFEAFTRYRRVALQEAIRGVLDGSHVPSGTLA